MMYIDDMMMMILMDDWMMILMMMILIYDWIRYLYFSQASITVRHVFLSHLHL